MALFDCQNCRANLFCRQFGNQTITHRRGRLAQLVLAAG